MSGGHFDYAPYRIDDIIAGIEREIEAATKERPPIIKEKGVSVKQKISEGHYRYPSWCLMFSSFESAEKYFLTDNHYKEIDRRMVDGEMILTVQCPAMGEVYEISTYTSERYAPDENGEEGYYPDWSEETLQTFRRAIDIIKRAGIYINRIDYLLSGEDGEENFHERLKEELNKLEEESNEEREGEEI